VYKRVGVQFWAVCGRGKSFFGKSIEIYKTIQNMKKYQNIFQKLERGSFGKVVGVGHGSTNLICVYVSRISMLI